MSHAHCVCCKSLHSNSHVHPVGMPRNQIVVGDRDTVLGLTPEAHDIDPLAPLRSHGSLEETTVPMFFNFALSPPYSKRLSTGKARSNDMLDFLCNGARAADDAAGSSAASAPWLTAL
jgi:hypothetical protein